MKESTWTAVIWQVNSGFQLSSQIIAPNLVNKDIQELSRASSFTCHLSTQMIDFPPWA